MKRLFLIFCLFLGLGFAASLRAQDDPEIAQEAAALGPKSPALKALLARQGENKDFVLETLRGARDLKAQGLPTEPYLLKANEGLAKGIPTKRILSALKDSQKRTETAARLVDSASRKGSDLPLPPQTRQRAIIRMQRLLSEGVSPKDIEKSLDQGRAGSESFEKRLDATTRGLSSSRHVLIPAPVSPKEEKPASEKVQKPDHEGEGLAKKVEKGKVEKESFRGSNRKSVTPKKETAGHEKQVTGHPGGNESFQGSSHGHGQGKGKK